MNVPIKWTGSKRPYVKTIGSLINGDKYSIYIEPFVGGGSMFLYLLEHNAFKEYHINDVNSDLISVWEYLKKHPQILINQYRNLWNLLNSGQTVEERKFTYGSIRDEFNITRDPGMFLFLLRTSFNGLVRYNSKNEFNTSFHFSRKGVDPKTMEKMILKWSALLKDKPNIIITNTTYKDLTYPEKCFAFLDPPYFNGAGHMYKGLFDHDEFFKFTDELKCAHIITLDRKVDGYEHHELKSKGSFKKLIQKDDTNSSEFINFKKWKNNMSWSTSQQAFQT